MKYCYITEGCTSWHHTSSKQQMTEVILVLLLDNRERYNAIIVVILKPLALLSLVESFVQSPVSGKTIRSFSLFLSKWLPRKRCVLNLFNYFSISLCKNFVIVTINMIFISIFRAFSKDANLSRPSKFSDAR